jgi:hypothetical protein
MATIVDKLSPYNVKQRIPYGPPVQNIIVAGAINIANGVVFIGSAGALAVTLGDPPLDMDGCELVIQASTAQAHTVTYTAGFNGGTTSNDVATFGGAVGDNLVLRAKAGLWLVQSKVNVTIA